MREARLMSDAHIDLDGMNTLLVDPDHFDRDIIVQMLRTFGAPLPTRVGTGAAAKAYLENHQVDLCICEATLPDMDGADLIQWIRHRRRDSLRSIPIIVLTGDTQLATVAKARDSGANIVVRRPVSPRTLHEHIVWVLTTHRPMVEAGQYVGPDRRFRDTSPPEEGERRTHSPVFTRPEPDAPDAAAPVPDEATGTTSA